MYFLYSWLEQVIAIKEDITSYNSQTRHQDKKKPGGDAIEIVDPAGDWR